MTLSFAPAEAWWFTPCCMAGLFLLLAGSPPCACLMTGFIFGCGWFAAGFWWLAPGLAIFSDGGPVLSFALTVALVGYLALFPACAAAAVGYLRLATGSAGQSRWPQRCAMAALWTLAEWFRGICFGGLPWLSAGYAQGAGPLAGFAPLIGVYGLTFLVALLAAYLSDWLAQLTSVAAWRSLLRLPAAAALLGMSGHWLQALDWTDDTGRVLTVRLLQGNLPQHDKFSIGGFRRALATYGTLASTSSANLTVLPETALPVEWFSMPEAVAPAWRRIALERNTAMVIGAVVARAGRDGEPMGVTNSAVGILPLEGKEGFNYRYDKAHLVPFGETMPAGAEWLGKRLNMDFGSFVPGAAQQPVLVLPQAKVAISICFEDMFDTVVADKARSAEVILNVSNFAWFTGTYAPAQHLQVAQLRALETGRWFIQASNTGMTALIDQHGQVRDMLPEDVTGVLDGTVKLFEGNTPFMLAGNIPLLLACLLAIAWSAHRRRHISRMIPRASDRAGDASPPDEQIARLCSSGNAETSDNKINSCFRDINH